MFWRALADAWRAVFAIGGGVRVGGATLVARAGAGKASAGRRHLGRVGGCEDLLGHAVVPGRAAIADVDDRVADIADQMAVVGDEEDGAGVGGERVLEHIATRQVEMVGGLVEHEQVHRLDHRAGEREARAFATGEVAHHPVGGITGKPKLPSTVRRLRLPGSMPPENAATTVLSRSSSSAWC